MIRPGAPRCKADIVPCRAEPPAAREAGHGRPPATGAYHRRARARITAPAKFAYFFSVDGGTGAGNGNVLNIDFACDCICSCICTNMFFDCSM